MVSCASPMIHPRCMVPFPPHAGDFFHFTIKSSISTATRQRHRGPGTHVASGPPFTALALRSDRGRSVGRRCDVVGRPDLDQMDWLDEADNSPGEQGTLLTSPSPAIARSGHVPDTRSLLGSVALRGDKKKHASRCNLRVRWIFFDSSVGAIAFTSQALSGHAMETFIGRLLYQCVPARQLPLAGGVREHGVCSLRARAGPGESAQPCCRGTLRVDGHVYGAGGRDGSRDGRTGKTVCGVFLADTKRDVVC